ncbi:MAG TPA: hypothetical protein ENI33_07690 [Thermoplasmatales archaeon]|nr:hypothetical protein [Thermoplasmatales archaeon]
MNTSIAICYVVALIFVIPPINDIHVGEKFWLDNDACILKNEWNKTYGGKEDDMGYVVLDTQDGYIIGGRTFSYGAGDSDIWIIKTDKEGNEIWNKTYGGKDAEYIFDVISVEDGYIIAGQTFSYSAGMGDGWLIKIDKEGNEIWNKTYGGKLDEDARKILETNDGYIFVAGCWSFGSPNGNVWLVKVDKEGNEIWNKTYGGKNHEIGYSITEDGGKYILGGITRSFGAGGYDIWIIKTDKEGNEIWNKTYGGKLDEDARKILETNDGYIFVAGCWSFGSPNGNVWLVKVDKEGNEIWNKTYGGKNNEYGGIVKQTDKGYVIMGQTSSFGDGKSDLWLLKVDKEGNEIWKRRIGGSSLDYGVTVKSTDDKGYIIAGLTSSFGAGKNDVWFLRTEEPSLEIEIYGGIGITVIFRNVGEEELTNLEWDVVLTDAVFFGKERQGSISSFMPGDEYKIKLFVFGIGEGKVKVRIGDISKNEHFWIIGPFVNMNH